MRAMPLSLTPMSFTLTGCAFLIGLTIVANAQAEAVKVTPQLTVFTKDEARPADGLPTVLRGSATRRGTVDGRFGSLFVCDERRYDCFDDRPPYDGYR